MNMISDVVKLQCSSIDINGKREIITQLKDMLTLWEKEVDKIGNECAYTDRILDDLPELVNKIMNI